MRSKISVCISTAWCFDVLVISPLALFSAPVVDLSEIVGLASLFLTTVGMFVDLGAFLIEPQATNALERTIINSSLTTGLADFKIIGE